MPFILAKVKGAIAVALLAAIAALVDYIGGIDWVGQLGPFGPLVGAGLAAGIAWLVKEPVFEMALARLRQYAGPEDSP